MDFLLYVAIWIPGCLTFGFCWAVHQRRMRAVELAKEERLRLTDRGTVELRIAEMSHERLMLGDGK